MAKLDLSILLAEILRLQRWAGGDSVSAARIYGLMNGFESALEQESECFGISKTTQTKVEDILEEIEAGTQSADGLGLKSRMHGDGINETDFSRVVELCRLESRFPDAVDAISDSGSMLALKDKLPEQEWFGALHYMELVELADGENKSHAVFAASVPREGEIVTTSDGTRMRVISVEHELRESDDGGGLGLLVPNVFMQPADSSDD